MGMLLTYREGYYPNDERDDENEREAVEHAGAHPEESPETETTEGEPKPGSKAELQALAEEFGLDSSGTKAELTERLDAYQADAAEQYDADQPTEGGSDSE